MAMLLVALVAALVAFVSAADPGPVNDFCVADLKSPVFSVNGLLCKDPATVKSEEFAFRDFRADADSDNPLGIGISPGFASVNYPALNTQGISLAKFNFAKGGLVPPHTHPRASEVLTVIEGEVYVGFVDTAGKLYAETVKKDDFFLFPQGLVHFQINSGGGHAKTVSVLNAQNPGVQLMPSSLFGSSPTIESEILAKAFGISVSEVDKIKKGFQPA